MFREVFANELNLIKDEDLRESIALLLDTDIDSYIYEVPASSTGKYHPKFSQGAGGLIRHTKAMVKMLTVFESARPDLDWDCMYSAAILHDCCKFSRDGSRSTYNNHADSIYNLLLTKSQKYADINYLISTKLQKVAELTRYHMGRFDSDIDTCKEVMKEDDWIIHYADMIVSRKWYGTKEFYV